MEFLRESAERAVDDIIVELVAADGIRWHMVEAAARRLLGFARELRRLNQAHRRI